MPLDPALLRAFVEDGLSLLKLGYFSWSDGTLYWRGTRPGPDWHAHGVYFTHPRDLQGGLLVRVRVAKQRWKHKVTHETRHSEPPDSLGKHYTALVIALCLFIWLDAVLGLHTHKRLFSGLNRIAPRTLQRWLRRACPLSLQQGIRVALLERGHPPEELFPQGIPPPQAGRRQWKAPDKVEQLHRGLTMTLSAAIAMQIPAAQLLKEARRTPHEPFLIA